MEMPALSTARPLAAAVLALVAALPLAVFPLAAGAQQVYRIVGPDGRVTFSDRPPAENGKASTAPSLTLPPAGGTSVASLPFELRTVASRFPVTLYSRPGCAPCDSGRIFLSSRGVPFAERTVTTADDVEALQRLAGSPTLPFVTIGGQQIKGFSQTEWGQFLDAAGYPKTSALPSSYRQAQPQPLVAAAPATAPGAAAPAGDEPRFASPSQPSGPAPANPAGIQF